MSSNLTAALLAALLVSFNSACGDDDADADGGGASSFPDAETPDGTSSEPEPGEDGGDDDAGRACDADSDCDDNLVCNGTEQCEEHRCVSGALRVCPTEHPCLEQQHGCDCHHPSADGDEFPDAVCNDGSRLDDCDDGNGLIFPGADEICDLLGVDEDCVPTTFSNISAAGELLDGDDDSDGEISDRCFNVNPGGGEHRGDDCRDNNPTIHRGSTEVCDYQDNDCNGVVDEAPAADGGKSMIAGGLEEAFYPDRDGDGCGDMHAEPAMECGFLALPGFVRGQDPCDCDDENPLARNNSLEVCDGADNDCDDLVDQADESFVQPYHFPQTHLVCKPDAQGAHFEIDVCPPDLVWCTGIVDFGCTVDATTIDHCRDCDRTCTFACGQEACDEVADLALGSDHSCARTAEGTVACWGYGLEGRLGGGFQASANTATEVIRIADAKLIASGPSNSCAVVNETRDLYCWGSNAAGLLATSDVPFPTPELPSPFSAIPLPVSGYASTRLQGVESVAIANAHACASLSSGDVYCWGSELDGRLGDGSSSTAIIPFPTPVRRDMGQLVDDALSVVVGFGHGCIINDAHSVECWGDNSLGQLGDPEYTELSSSIARLVPNLGMVTKLTASRGHTCALADGQVFCWGLNDRYQLGRESGPENASPLPMVGLDDIEDISAGPTFTCAVDAAGAVWCWGSNDSGERGGAEVGDTFEPQRIDLDQPARSVFAGAAHACAVTKDEPHEAYCWGSNFLGQLGTGQSSDIPVLVPEAIQPLARSRK